LSAARVKFFANSSDAAAFLCEMLQPGDLLLIKGSRGVKMERIVEVLREGYALAGDLAGGPAAGQGHG
jgi:UDP-N-acetylmuramyl pentapeptide synthase